MASSGLALLTAGCLGGLTGSSSDGFTTAIPYTPADDQTACVPGNDVIGTWKVLADNRTFIPGSADISFFSFNPPSVNTSGLVVFRGRAKAATGSGGAQGSGGGGAMSRGVFAVDACLGSLTLYTVADTTMAVPAPNNTDASFTEFPSFPRIDIDSGVLATRGQSTPVWTLPDGTKTGTSGVYVSLPTGLSTGIGQLGNVSEFSYMQVPGASTPGIRFDQFPGSPTLTQGRYLVFKGNYTDGTTAKTGVYFRDLNAAGTSVQRIADTNMLIPDTATAFGSTAPPSAAGGHVVFVGLDNESAPTAGGLYIAPVADQPALTPLVQIGLTVVPDGSGNPLPDNPTFSEIGEGVSFDGRYVAFWGAWNTQNAANLRPITLQCPTEGNAALQAACLQQYPSGQTTMDDPIDQGIFLYDTKQGSLRMVARAGTGEAFQDFLYWNFSGNAGASGGSTSSGGSGSSSGSGSSGSSGSGSSGSGSSGSSGSSEASGLEPPRWRVSAFAAVDGTHGVIFLGTLQPAASGSTPESGISGIYGAALTGNTIGPVFKVVAIGDDMLPLDPAAPAGSTVASLAIERESLRGGWMSITASSLDPAGESWAGIYTTFFPGPFHVIPAVPPATIATLVLGN